MSTGVGPQLDFRGHLIHDIVFSYEKFVNTIVCNRKYCQLGVLWANGIHPWISTQFGRFLAPSFGTCPFCPTDPPLSMLTHMKTRILKYSRLQLHTHQQSHTADWDIWIESSTWAAIKPVSLKETMLKIYHLYYKMILIAKQSYLSAFDPPPPYLLTNISSPFTIYILYNWSHDRKYIAKFPITFKGWKTNSLSIERALSQEIPWILLEVMLHSGPVYICFVVPLCWIPFWLPFPCFVTSHFL